MTTSNTVKSIWKDRPRTRRRRRRSKCTISIKSDSLFRRENVVPTFHHDHQQYHSFRDQQEKSRRRRRRSSLIPTTSTPHTTSALPSTSTTTSTTRTTKSILCPLWSMVLLRYALLLFCPTKTLALVPYCPFTTTHLTTLHVHNYICNNNQHRTRTQHRFVSSLSLKRLLGGGGGGDDDDDNIEADREATTLRELLQVRQQLVQDVQDAERKQRLLEEQINNAKVRQQQYQNQAKRGRATIQQLTQRGTTTTTINGNTWTRGVQNVLQTAKRLVQENQQTRQIISPLEQERELLEQEIQAMQRKQQSQQSSQRSVSAICISNP
jgi:hypothetical protein